MTERRRRYERNSPQRRETDLGWAAGVVDSESTVRLNGGSPEVKIDMLDRPCLERLARLLGGRVRPNSTRRGRRQVHRWQLQGGAARVVLTRLLPYLTEKADQVQLLLTILPNRKGVMLTAAQRTERARVQSAVSLLKQREFTE
jgi:hypothetical protein